MRRTWSWLPPLALAAACLAFLAPLAPTAAAADPTPSPEPTVSAEPSAAPTPSPSPTPSPTFGLNVYRTGAWVRQYTSDQCTAAATQMMINMIRGRQNASTVLQANIYRYARNHDMLAPSSRGSDPAGWAAALRKFGGGSYHFSTYGGREAALRAAATAIRATGRPVGILAHHGRHAWVMTGFTSAEDPAKTVSFSVTSAFVSGPLADKDPRPNRQVWRPSVNANFTVYLERDGWLGWVGKYDLVLPG